MRQLTPPITPALAVLALLATSPAVSGVSAQSSSSSEIGLKVGQTFPSLALPSLEDGRPRSITEFRGEKLILHVFASW